MPRMFCCFFFLTLPLPRRPSASSPPTPTAPAAGGTSGGEGRAPPPPPAAPALGTLAFLAFTGGLPPPALLPTSPRRACFLSCLSAAAAGASIPLGGGPGC
ncbi:hypothetical protein V8C86DRAFT_2639212, partial [Haematococcus lacustris]